MGKVVQSVSDVGVIDGVVEDDGYSSRTFEAIYNIIKINYGLPDRLNAKQTVFVIRVLLSMIDGKRRNFFDFLGSDDPSESVDLVKKTRSTLSCYGISLSTVGKRSKLGEAFYSLGILGESVDFSFDADMGVLDELCSMEKDLISRIHEPFDEFRLYPDVQGAVDDTRSKIRRVLKSSILQNGLVAPENKNIARFVVGKTIDDSVAVSVDRIMAHMNEKGFTDEEGEKRDYTYEEIKQRVGRFFKRVNESGDIGVRFLSQPHPSTRKFVGYYASLKPSVEVHAADLSESLFEVSPEDRDKLLKLIDIAFFFLSGNSPCSSTMLCAMKDALINGKSANSEYCMFVQQNRFPDSTLNIRNYTEGVSRLANILNDYGLFEIVVDGNRFQPRLLGNSGNADKFIDEWESFSLFLEEDVVSLNYRVMNSFRYLSSNRSDEKDCSNVLEKMVDMTIEGRPFLVSEVGDERGFVHEVIKRIQRINEMYPHVLGFNICAIGMNRYVLKLDPEYVDKGGLLVSGQFAYFPMTVPEDDYSFDYDEFKRLLKKIRKSELMPNSKTMLAIDFIARHSARKEAVSKSLIVGELGNCNLPRIIKRMSVLFDGGFKSFGVKLVVTDSGCFYFKKRSASNRVLEDKCQLNDLRECSVSSVSIDESGGVHLLPHFEVSTNGLVLGSDYYEVIRNKYTLETYRSLIDSRFRIVDREKSDPSVYAFWQRKLFVGKSENLDEDSEEDLDDDLDSVLIALDDSMSKISKVKLSCLRIAAKETSNYSDPFKDSQFLKWLNGGSRPRDS